MPHLRNEMLGGSARAILAVTNMISMMVLVRHVIVRGIHGRRVLDQLQKLLHLDIVVGKL